MTKVYLSPRRAGAAIGRHPWVFKGVISKVEGTPATGDVVSVYRSEEDRNEFVAFGFWNAKSDIAIRLFSWNPEELDTDEWLNNQMVMALAYRQNTLGIAKKTACRWISSEGDGISGLTVDGFSQYLVLQVTSAALEKRIEKIVSVLKRELDPKAILLRQPSDSLRQKEGLELQAGTLWGEAPTEEVQNQEGKILFSVDLQAGQKTGHFLDQRLNHERAATFAKNRTVLDLYSYTGGFALHCAKGGAEKVVVVESSAWAIEQCEKNAKLNSISNIEFQKQDVFEFLQASKPTSFSMVIVDPPKLSPSQKDKERALQKYFRLNVEALRVLDSSGIFITCSCSGSVTQQEWVSLVASAGKKAKKSIRIIEVTGASPDHPVNPYCPESQYLKCLFAQVQ